MKKPDQNLINVLAKSKFPEIYRIEKHHFLKHPLRPTFILKKEENDKAAIKIARLFNQWLEQACDINKEVCFLCGFYILVEYRTKQYAKRPYKNGDLVHVDCWNRMMKFEHVNERISDKSQLICHYETIYNGHRLCRDRVQNTKESILTHLQQKHNWNSPLDWTFQRSQFFLMPKGKPFADRVVL